MGDAVPQTPWDLSLWGHPDDKNTGHQLEGSLCIRIATCIGARVASQHGPILRAGSITIIPRPLCIQDKNDTSLTIEPILWYHKETLTLLDLGGVI